MNPTHVSPVSPHPGTRSRRRLGRRSLPVTAGFFTIGLVTVGLVGPPAPLFAVQEAGGVSAVADPSAHSGPAAAPDTAAQARVAEEVTPEISEEIDVTLVQLDVLVTDRRGAPVTDLRREDFRLLEDGRPVELSGFSGPAAVPSEAAPSEAAPAAEDRPVFLTLALQTSFLGPGDLTGVAESLRELVAGLDPDIRVMLVQLGGSTPGGLTVLQAPTADRQALLASLDAFEAAGAPGTLAAEYGNLLGDIRRRTRQGLDDRFLPTGAAQIELLLTRIGAFAERAYRELETSLLPLRGLLEGLSGLPGRREVLLVSGRLPATAAQSLFDAWRASFGRTSSFWSGIAANPGGGGEGALGSSLEFESLTAGAEALDTSPLLSSLVRQAQAAGVTLHSFDVSTSGGARRSPDVAAGIAGEGAAVGASLRGLADAGALRDLAADTGGRALSRGRDLETSLADLGRELGSSYRLAFVPPRGADGRLHEVAVEVRGPGRLEVRHRPAYRALGRDQETARRLLPALWWGIGENPLQAEVSREATADEAVGEGAASRAEAPVRFAVRVPVANLALVPDGAVHRGRLTVFFVAGGAELSAASTSGVSRAVVPVRIPNREILAAQGRSVEYIGEVPSPGPGGRVAVAVRDDLQDLTSLLRLSLDVEPADARSEATAPAVPAAHGRVSALESRGAGG